ncbi:DUF2975 domain-containing protein [Chitinophaga pendula]|uniref:DUF2975 domain-containing protein n=1 Tax=Chitinophaga TaxID=79328 RepID=UPI000BAFC5B1|nr:MULTISPECIES: DUF2975 domain-containing protein [Chitinophaga]ASZ13902.1 hypothetical protein CK934_24555 [Chitinophaga sp. MD30]UCJ08480.1 DUF2975 domain-containing protein [Chitinophaga pendula]
MQTNTQLMLKVLSVLAWIIFIGVCIEAGAFITNAFFALVKPGIVNRLWQQVDLSALFKYDRSYFFTEMLIMSIVGVMRAYLFYVIITMLHNKHVNLSQPFSHTIRRYILKLSYAALAIGLFSWYGVEYAEWLITQGVKMPDTQYLRLGGADVWLFMSVILFVIAQVFKRGIEMQTENELTV